MLEEVLTYLKNWFEVKALRGAFRVEGGAVALPEGFAAEGQYLRVRGSALNDGLWTFPLGGMADEEFEGTIYALAVPPAVQRLAESIEEWQEANGEAARSPYASESFGGYSYSLRADSAPEGASGGSWQAVFRAELNRWRKL